MQEVTFTELRNHAKRYFDKVERGETVRLYRNGRPIGDLVPASSHMPAWKNPPKPRITLNGIWLSEEIIADREKSQ
jgi:prevent-host-death family protein